MPDRPAPRQPARTRAVFPPTRWSLVARVQAGDADSAAIEPHLIPEEDRAPYRELAVQLASSEGSARLLIYRMRRKFRELLEEEIARTVTDPAEIPDELAWMRVAQAER